MPTCQLGITFFGDVKITLHHAHSTTTNPRINVYHYKPHRYHIEWLSQHIYENPAATCSCDTTTILHISQWLDSLQMKYQFTDCIPSFTMLVMTLSRTPLSTLSDIFHFDQRWFSTCSRRHITKKANPAVHWLTFSSLFHSVGVPINDLVVQLKSVSLSWVHLSRMS